jgi:iron(III) transport system permease protein
VGAEPGTTETVLSLDRVTKLFGTARAVITFVGVARNMGNFALLTTTANRPLSMLQLDYVAQRKLEEVVVVACVIMFVSLGGALLARLLGLRSGSLG